MGGGPTRGPTPGTRADSRADPRPDSPQDSATGPDLAQTLVTANLQRGASPDGWTASVDWPREQDVPDEVYFPAIEASGRGRSHGQGPGSASGAREVDGAVGLGLPQPGGRADPGATGFSQDTFGMMVRRMP
jgi:hypothetical protein